jgi:putative ABC transport system substrate-binding protein
MKRREFILALGGVAAWSLAARSQQSDRMRRVGVLAPFNEKDPESQVNFTAFKKRLIDLGWIEGRNLTIVYKFTGGSTEKIRAAAEQLVAAAPDMIFAASNVSVAPLQKMTSTIPIVFTQVSDPVGSGFVASLAQPGGNITGFQGYEAEIGSKWLEVLREIVPRVRRVAVLLNPNVSANVAFFHTAETAAASWQVTVTAVGVRAAAEIEPAVAAFAWGPDDAMIVTPSPLTNTTENRALLFALAARLSLPAIYPYRLIAGSTGLISYSYAAAAQWQGGATYLDRILRGAKPAELPVQAPTKYDMVINLKTARALSLTVPPSLLARADEVIE